MKCIGLVTAALCASAFAAQGDPASSLPAKPLRPPRLDAVTGSHSIARGALNAARKQNRVTPELEKLAEAAFRMAPPRRLTDASEQQDYSAGYRLLTQLTVRLTGHEWNEGSELASAFDFQIERSLITTGEPLKFQIEPWFTTGRMPTSSYLAGVELRTAAGQLAERLTPIVLREFRRYVGSFGTALLRPGRYVVRYELRGPDEKLLAEAERDSQVSGDALRRVGAVKKKLAEIGNLRKSGASYEIAASTVEFLCRIIERAGAEYVAHRWRNAHPFSSQFIPVAESLVSGPFDLQRDLALAEQLAGALLGGSNPLVGRTGDMHLAYRSAVDDTLQPFRLFVPEPFDRSRKYALIVALHGGAGDENSYMDAPLYDSPHSGRNLLKELAQQRGYIVAAPNGRGSNRSYVGDSQQDVMDVLDLVEQLYPVEHHQVFLTGHSMGGNGTWRIGFQYPRRFGALAPVACSFGGNLAEFRGFQFGDAPGMPVLFSYGLQDNTALPEHTRRLAALAKTVLANFRAEEYPEDDHLSIGLKSMPRIFDFFDEQRKRRGVEGVKQP